VALAWLLERPAVTWVIIGARTGEQLLENLAAAELSLTADELGRLEQVSRPPLLYPYWHQAKTAADWLGPADLPLLGPPHQVINAEGNRAGGRPRLKGFAPCKRTPQLNREVLSRALDLF
jgi:hypothetical protein